MEEIKYPEPPEEQELTTSEGTNLYMVTALSTVPMTKEFFHTFHSAYLYAFRVCEGNRTQVDIAHGDKYIMILRPDNRTVHI